MTFSPEWVLGGFWDFLIPKKTWNILYKGGEGEFFGKWLLPENGFSWEIQNTSHFNLIWELRDFFQCELLDENVLWQSLHPKYFRFGIILEKQLTPVAKVGFFNILYH